MIHIYMNSNICHWIEPFKHNITIAIEEIEVIKITYARSSETRVIMKEVTQNSADLRTADLRDRTYLLFYSELL